MRIEIPFADGVSRNAPCFEGHFPNHPILPGAMLLGYASVALGQKGLRIASVSRMKFTRPLSPDQAFAIEIDGKDHAAKIVWRCGNDIIAEARATLSSN